MRNFGHEVPKKLEYYQNHHKLPGPKLRVFYYGLKDKIKVINHAKKVPTGDNLSTFPMQTMLLLGSLYKDERWSN